MTLPSAELAYFARGTAENARFWARLGGKPALTGAAVLDVGCGHGSLCVDIADSGARRVLGLDLNTSLIDFAAANIRLHHPEVAATIEFRRQDVREISETGFDLCVSKDTFEHVMDLAEVLAAIKLRLRPGGRLYAGFGPLWHSPFGDHGRTEIAAPWGHVVLPERYLISRLNRRHRTQLNSIHDLGLNKLALADYMRLLRQSGFKIITLKVNVSTHPMSRLFSWPHRLPLLREYFAHNIYCILENELAEDGR